MPDCTSRGWQLGDLDLSGYLDRYRDQRLVLIIAPVGETKPATQTFDVRGFLMNEVAAELACRCGDSDGDRVLIEPLVGAKRLHCAIGALRCGLAR